MTKIKHSLLCGVTAFAAVGVVAVASMTAAQAGGFALREQSSIGQGTSYAGVAAGGALSSMFWNPATLTQTKGTNTESVFSAIVPSTDVKNISAQRTTTNSSGVQIAPTVALPSGDPGDVGLSAVVPSSYSGMQLTDDLYVGLSVNAPYGLATKSNPGSASAFHAMTSEVFNTDVKANIAYRINDAFSIGAAVGVAYGKVRLTSAPFGTGLAIEGDAWAPVFGAGATFTPREGTVIGVGFRSGTTFDLKGDEHSSVAGHSKINATLELPAQISVGVRQDVTDKLTMMAGFEWTNWSTLKDPVPIGGSATGATLHMGYEDSWYASVGAEYAYNDKLTLRTGLGYEKSPVPDEHKNLRLPDNDRIWASLGASYNVTDKLGVDFGYTHLFVDQTKVHGSRSRQVSPTAFWNDSYTATADSSVHIISVSGRYQWKAEPMFAGDDPIVRKY